MNKPSTNTTTISIDYKMLAMAWGSFGISAAFVFSIYWVFHTLF